MLNSREVKDYLSHHHIPQLLESVLTGLLYHHPADPISFLHSCLNKTGQLGGPEAVTWDTFIHLERRQLSPGPPRTTSLSPRAALVPTRTASVRPRTTYIPTRAQPAPPIPKKGPRIPFITPLKPIPPIITDKTPLLDTSVLIPQTATLTPQTAIQKTQISPPIPQTAQNIPQTSTPTPWIISPTPAAALLTQSGPQSASVNSKLLVLPHFTPSPQVSTTNNKTAADHFHVLLPQVLPEPAVTLSPPLIKRQGQPDTTSFSTEGPPPSPVRSQLSIDSDSDLTESSGLQQEVSIRPPQKPRPLIFFIIGGPGSGKGSQAAKLAQSFDLKVVSLDELLRVQLLSQASPSRKWEVISQMMSHGELGPQEETILELRRLLIAQREVKGFIVDGFPRDIHQALSFQEKIGTPDLVMLLLCSNETLRSRLQRRATELGLLGDSSHALRKRLDTFQKEIISIMRYYRQLHLLKKVNGDRDEDLVFADLDSVIRGKLPQKESSESAGTPEGSSAVSPVSSHNQ